MSFDLPAELESRVVRYAERSNVTPDEAVRALLDDGLQRAGTSDGSISTDERDPERTIGLFADLPGFEEAIQKVISERESRYTKSR